MSRADRLLARVSAKAALREGEAVLEAGNPARAFALFARAAKSGAPEAQHRVARCYLEATGVPPSAEEGVRWLERAAAQDHVASMVLLAGLHVAWAAAAARRWRPGRRRPPPISPPPSAGRAAPPMRARAMRRPFSATSSPPDRRTGAISPKRMYGTRRRPARASRRGRSVTRSRSPAPPRTRTTRSGSSSICAQRPKPGCRPPSICWAC